MNVTAIQNGNYINQDTQALNVAASTAQSPVQISEQFKNTLKLDATDNAQKPKVESPSLIKLGDVEKQFQATIIGIMLKPLFVEMANSISGKGVQADVYTSLITNAVSMSLAESGALDMGKYFTGSGDQQNSVQSK